MITARRSSDQTVRRGACSRSFSGVQEERDWLEERG
jgi:hypothetical protein